jgi:hypothetical protein
MMVAAKSLCALLLGAAEQRLPSIVISPFDFNANLEDHLGFFSYEKFKSILSSPFDLTSKLRDCLSRKAVVKPTLSDVQVLPKLTLQLKTLPALWNVADFESSSQITEFNRANTPGSWEYFDQNRPPNLPPYWEYFHSSRRFATCKNSLKLIAERVLGAGQESKIIRVKRKERRLRRRLQPHSLVASEQLPPIGAVRYWSPRGCVVIHLFSQSLFSFPSLSCLPLPNFLF